VLNPGAKRLWRVYDDRGVASADVLSLTTETLRPGSLHLHHHARPDVARDVEVAAADELLVSAVDHGRVLVDDDLDAAVARRTSDVARLDPGVRRLVRPHTYHVSITDGVFALKEQLLATLH
jgi:nicotinate phosphoribosyltransferase